MDEFDDTIARMKTQEPKEGIHFLRASSDPRDIMAKVQQGLAILAERK